MGLAISVHWAVVTRAGGCGYVWGDGEQYMNGHPTRDAMEKTAFAANVSNAQ